MLFKLNNSNSNTKCRWQHAFVVHLFLSIFFLSQVGANLHFDIDQAEHDNAHCTVEDEENQCHIKIVHGDLNSGCDHRQHLTEVELKCQLCAMLGARQIMVSHGINKSFSITKYKEAYCDCYAFSFVALANQAHPHRGPPQV